MPALQSEFVSFHDTIKLGAYEEEKSLRDKRDLLINELEKSLADEKIPGTERKLTFTKLDQGSYAMSTGIIPHKGDYDIDVAICFDIDKEEYGSHALKTLVFDKLDNHAKRTVEFKRPCVSVKYADGYHVDLVIYTRNNNDMHIAWGKQYVPQEQTWFEADPKGLTKWIQDVSSETERRDQFRRCVRAIKKWKHINFISKGNSAPPSIGLTIQARQSFAFNKDNDFDALINIAQHMKSSFYTIYDQEDQQYRHTTEVSLPVRPYKNVYYKMTCKQMDAFYESVCDFLEALEAAKESDSAHEASKILRKVFGTDFPLVEDSKKTNNAPYVVTGHNA